MKELVDKQKFIDNTIDEYYIGYAHLLAHQIKDEGFTALKYDKAADIISVCDTAINCLLNTFEQVVTELLTSFEDVKEFIHLYSYFSNPTNKKHIIFRYTCRYILSIIPKLKIKSEHSPRLEMYNMFELCKLIALTKLLHTFIQAKSLQLIENSSCLQIEIDTIVIIKYTKQTIIELNSNLENSSRLIHKNYVSDDDFEKLMSTLEVNSTTFRTLLDYTSQLMDRKADIFEVTREVENSKSDPVINGLLFSNENVNFHEVIYSPYNTYHRTRFRPILQLNIDNEIHYFTTAWMIMEALDEVSTNLMPYGELPKGWNKVHDLKLLCKNATKHTGKMFEDEVFKVLAPNYNVKRNISGFHNISLKKEIVPNTKRKVGEIDFILVDSIRKIIFVIDAKCTKTKYYFQSFAKDKSTFIEYSIKLNDKVDWIASHKDEVGKFFKVSNISDFSVNGLFVTNSLIYYHFFSDVPIIPLDKLKLYLEKLDKMCVIS